MKHVIHTKEENAYHSEMLNRGIRHEITCATEPSTLCQTSQLRKLTKNNHDNVLKRLWVPSQELQHRINTMLLGRLYVPRVESCLKMVRDTVIQA